MYGAFKNLLYRANDGVLHGIKENDMRRKYLESTYDLTVQENNKGIKSFRPFW